MPTTRTKDAGLPTLVSELWQLVIAYAKQETIEPIKGLGRYVAFGLAGSLLIGHGLVLLGLAGLRAMQTETGDLFAANLSFVPYFVVVIAAAALAGVSGAAIVRKKRS